jgi:hypothetical protein
MKTIIRHGDVILIPANKELEKTELKKENTIAYGEATGHHHTIYAKDSASGSKVIEFDGKKYLHLFGTCELKHQEHDPIKLPSGVYEIKIERERDPFLNEIKKVVD